MAERNKLDRKLSEFKDQLKEPVAYLQLSGDEFALILHDESDVFLPNLNFGLEIIKDDETGNFVGVMTGGNFSLSLENTTNKSGTINFVALREGSLKFEPNATNKFVLEGYLQELVSDINGSIKNWLFDKLGHELDVQTRFVKGLLFVRTSFPTKED